MLLRRDVASEWSRTGNVYNSRHYYHGMRIAQVGGYVTVSSVDRLLPITHTIASNPTDERVCQSIPQIPFKINLMEDK